VGSFFVEALPPHVQRRLLFDQAAAYQPLDLVGYIPMHAFVAAVFFRMPWSDAIQVDSEDQPPCREPCQSQQPVATGERCAVVAADDSRQAVLFE
jgi:hypothetical protein